MQKKAITFSSVIQANKKALPKFYYKYIFLIIVFSTVSVSVILYFYDAHIALFGNMESALGEAHLSGVYFSRTKFIKSSFRKVKFNHTILDAVPLEKIPLRSKAITKPSIYSAKK